MRRVESVQALLRATRSRAGRFRRSTLKASVRWRSSRPPTRFGTRFAMNCPASDPAYPVMSLICVRLARVLAPKHKLSKLSRFGDAQIGRKDAQQAYDP